MKNSILSSLILVAGLISCNRVQEMQNPTAEAPAQGVFHATIESPGNDATKVYTDEALHVLWNKDDYITIFAKTTRNKKFHFKGVDGATGGDFEEVSSGFGTGSDIDFNYAVYPYDERTGYIFDDQLHAWLPRTQAYRAGSFGPDANLMVAKSSNEDLSFKNVGSYLCLKLYGDGISVRSIVLKSNGNETLSGPVTISFGAGNIPSMEFDTTDPDGLSPEIVLTPDAPVALGATEAAAVSFWMVVPPVTLPGGFTVTVIDGNGNTYKKSTTKSVSFERNHLKPMKAFEIKSADALPPLSVSEMGVHPITGVGFTYDKTQDQVNLYEQDGKVWARFLRIPTLTMIEIGPIPADVTAGSAIIADVTAYYDGAMVESFPNSKLTVQSVSGGILNLVSDDGTRYAIRF